MSEAATFRRDLAVLEQQFQALSPELELTVRDPALGVEGHVVVWNTGISMGGPLPYCGKGGTRITPTLTLDEVKMLARTMALKNAAAGLPLGGAKSGLRADPTAPNFETRYRRFVKLCAPILHENGGPFGGFGFDIGGAPIQAIWATEELQSLRCFTGKPLELGGTDYDREGIAGLGVAAAGKAAAESFGKTVSKLNFAVQGIGAMGAAVIRYFSGYGARLAFVSDPRLGGTWALPENLPADLLEALSHSDVAEAMRHLPIVAHKLSDDAADVLFQPVDILFPCAVQAVITDANMGRIQAEIVVEGANGPVQSTCYRPLAERGVTVIPDFIANPGGIIAAFVELTSAISVEENIKSRAKAQAAKDLTIAKISANVRAIMDDVQTIGISPREAGLALAYRRILES